MRNAIKDYYHELIDENVGNQTKMWKTIKKVLDKNENSVKLVSVAVGGKCLTREHDVLRALSWPFIAVRPNLAKEIVSRPDDDFLQSIKLEQNVLKFKTIDVVIC